LPKILYHSLLPTPPKNLPLFPESISSFSIDPFFYEDLARKDGYGLIAGVDEAGRGPLAGPVVAAAAILPPGVELTGIRDSKQMRAEVREEAFSVIHRTALATGIGVVSHRYIDEFNILKASLEAMKQAVLFLDPQPDFILVDGIHSVPLSIHQRCLKKGDQISRSISAASVLAKVYRDRIMRCYHDMYPEYGFDKHKGYGTARHMEAIKQYGPSPVHRMSFKGVS
jgi:ribonuclease HII